MLKLTERLQPTLKCCCSIGSGNGLQRGPDIAQLIIVDTRPDNLKLENVVGRNRVFANRAPSSLKMEESLTSVKDHGGG